MTIEQATPILSSYPRLLLSFIHDNKAPPTGSSQPKTDKKASYTNSTSSTQL